MQQTQVNSGSLVALSHGTGLGGAELSLLALLRRLHELGVSLSLITPERGALFERFAPVIDRSLILSFPYPRKPASWRHLPRWLIEGRVFVRRCPESPVLFSGDFLSLWAALLLCQGKAKVFSLWQAEYLFADDSCVRKWLRYGAARADRLLASEPVAAHANATGLLAQRVRVLNPFVDDHRFDPTTFDRQALRSRFGWKPDDHVALCTGRIGKTKGQLWLAEQFADRRDFPKSARLVLAGPGDENALASLQSASDRADGRIEILGPRSDVPALLAAADIAVLPGTFQESFGLAAIEAVLMTRPLLAFRVGALPCVLGDDYPGLVASDRPDDLIEQWKQLAQGRQPDRDGGTFRAKAVERFGVKAWQANIATALGLP